MESLTHSIFKLLFNQWIVDIRKNLQILNPLPHTRNLHLMRERILRFYFLRLQIGNLLLHSLDLVDLFGAVCLQNLARFLEALVGELVEGDPAGAGESRSAASRADESFTLGDGDAFASGGGDEFRVVATWFRVAC